MVFTLQKDTETHISWLINDFLIFSLVIFFFNLKRQQLSLSSNNKKRTEGISGEEKNKRRQIAWFKALDLQQFLILAQKLFLSSFITVWLFIIKKYVRLWKDWNWKCGWWELVHSKTFQKEMTVNNFEYFVRIN